MSMAVSGGYRNAVDRFVDSEASRPTLGLVYGRRRIGKSTMLEAVSRDRHGFYWEATRTERAIQLARLGEAVGQFLGVGKLAFENWEEAIAQLLRLGAGPPLPVVIDEFGYVLESDPSVDSIIATALGPAGSRGSSGQSRLILCGSAIALLRSPTAGQAPLRGRAGMELVMQAADYREAATWLGENVSPQLAARVYSVIGGVIGYATDMVDHDLPRNPEDFERWVVDRLLSPAATLHHEAATLLAEDPTLSSAKPVIHHSILSAIANGSVTAGRISKQLRRPVSNLEPAITRLIDAGFVVRHVDPVRSQRPTYALADPFLQFHYAVLEPSSWLLRDRNPAESWRRRLSATFDSQVRGPVFEEQARTWVRRYSDPESVGGEFDHVGPSVAHVGGKQRQLDLLVATANTPDALPAERTVVAIGEAKASETASVGLLLALEEARSALGRQAAHAKLLLFAPDFSTDLTARAAKRGDIELIDLDRLYHGS